MEIDKEKLVVRMMEMKDIPDVVQMEKDYFSDPWSEQLFVQAIEDKNQIFFSLCYEDEIAGYCGMQVVLDEGQILNVAVSEKFRRHGLGHVLLNAMFDYGRENGLSLFTLEVRESNIAARELYKKVGFKETGKRPRYYTDPVETAILMDYVRTE